MPKKQPKAADATQCVIYARYSSLAQRDQSIEDQVDVCRAWAKARSLKVAGVYADRHISGTTDSRPEFQRMVADAQAGKWGIVVVYKADRFARDRTDAAVYRRNLRELGVAVQSATEGIPDGPEGIIMEGLLDSMAEYYSRALSQNVLRGMMSNARKCKTNGVEVYGYRKAPDGTFEIDPETAPVVRELFERRAAGSTIKDLVRWMAGRGVRTRFGNPPNIQYVRGRLADEKYRGIYRFGDVRVEGGMPQIIDDELWDKVADMRGGRGPKGEAYPLVGKLYDAETGQAYRGECGTSHSGKRSYYYAVKASDKVKRYRVGVVESAVEEALAAVLQEPGLADSLAHAAVEHARSLVDESELRRLRARRTELKRQKANVTRAIAGGMNPNDFEEVLGEISQELDAVQGAIDEVKGPMIPDETQLADFIRHEFAGFASRTGKLPDSISRVEIDRSEDAVNVWFVWDEAGLIFDKKTANPQLEGVRQPMAWWAQ